MSILIRSSNGLFTLEASGFPNEETLEKLLAENPELLRPEGGSSLALVSRQVDLREAGILDLLFVSEEGLPIAVEVKLARNGQSRREVVAQAIDYISALTSLTNEELDQIVQGGLDKALHSFDGEEEGGEFERRWQAVGANLRAGLARLVIALDDTPPHLERIVRFLAQNSKLDVQLVAIERYAASEIGEVVVPSFVVGVESPERQRPPNSEKEPRAELLRTVEAYNSRAPADLQAVGVATYYRQIRPSDWPSSLRTHYEFYQTSSYIAAELHIESNRAQPLAATLLELEGRQLLGGSTTLQWDPNWSSKRGKLTVRFPLPTDSITVAQSMQELISMTREQVGAQLRELAKVAT